MGYQISSEINIIKDVYVKSSINSMRKMTSVIRHMFFVLNGKNKSVVRYEIFIPIGKITSYTRYATKVASNVFTTTYFRKLLIENKFNCNFIQIHNFFLLTNICIIKRSVLFSLLKKKKKKYSFMHLFLTIKYYQKKLMHKFSDKINFFYVRIHANLYIKSYTH